MIVYTFDYESGAYTGPQRLSASDIDLRAPDTLMIPGNATVIPPPRCGKKLWPFWRNEQWQVMEEVDPSETDYWADFGL